MERRMCDVTTTRCSSTRRVTQAIQHLSLCVAILFGGKRTVVRLYLSYYATPGITVEGQIAVRKLRPYPVGHDPLPQRSDAGSCSSRFDPTEAQRRARSLNFLPSRHTERRKAAQSSPLKRHRHRDGPTGHRGVRCEANPLVPPQPRRFGEDCLYALRTGTRRHVHVLPMSISIYSTLGSASPIPSRRWSVLGARHRWPPPPARFHVAIHMRDCGDSCCSMSIRDDSRTHYYGMAAMVASSCELAREFHGTAPATVASGQRGTSTWGLGFDGSYGRLVWAVTSLGHHVLAAFTRVLRRTQTISQLSVLTTAAGAGRIRLCRLRRRRSRQRYPDGRVTGTVWRDS